MSTKAERLAQVKKSLKLFHEVMTILENTGQQDLAERTLETNAKTFMELIYGKDA